MAATKFNTTELALESRQEYSDAELKFYAGLREVFDYWRDKTLYWFEEIFTPIYNRYEKSIYVNIYLKKSVDDYYGLKVVRYDSAYISKQAEEVIATVVKLGDVNPELLDDVMFGNMTEISAIGGNNSLEAMGIGMGFSHLDPNAITALKRYTKKLSTKVTRDISNKIKEQLIEGLKAHEGIPALQERISSVYAKPITVRVPAKVINDKVVREAYEYQLDNEKWAHMVARTEAARAYNTGRLLAYKDSGVVKAVEYAVAPDERLCPICAPLEGSVKTLEEANDFIPQHPNCRCTWIPILLPISALKNLADLITKSVTITDAHKKFARENLNKLMKPERKLGIDTELKGIHPLYKTAITDVLLSSKGKFGNTLPVDSIGTFEGGRENIGMYFDSVKRKLLVNKSVYSDLQTYFIEVNKSTRSGFLRETAIEALYSVLSVVPSIYWAHLSNSEREALMSRYKERERKTVIESLGISADLSFKQYLSELYATGTLDLDAIDNDGIKSDYGILATALTEKEDE